MSELDKVRNDAQEGIKALDNLEKHLLALHNNPLFDPFRGNEHPIKSSHPVLEYIRIQLQAIETLIEAQERS